MSIPCTPLRYPGGKQKIWRFIAETIEENALSGCDYVEPYAGGAGVAIELLLSGVVDKIHLNDSNPAVYAFWHSLKNHTDELCRKIASASLTVKEWERQRAIYKNPKDHDLVSLGFALFFLNRCNRSGILTAGIIGGKEQTGPWKMDARFERNSLIQRIERIALKRNKIRLKNLDAEKFITSHVNKIKNTTFTYCDPPYFAKADRLYDNYYSPSDHIRLSQTIKSILQGYWVVSYDNTPEITELYQSNKYFTYSLQYNASTVYKGTEIFIFCDSLKMPSQSSLTSINVALSGYFYNSSLRSALCGKERRSKNECDDAMAALRYNDCGFAS